MKTPENNSGAAQGTTTAEKSSNAKINNQTVNRPSIPGKDKNKTDEPVEIGTAVAVAEAANKPAAESEAPADEQQAAIVELPKGEEVKTSENKPDEENDELESNPYQGCKLIIKDDKGRDFTTIHLAPSAWFHSSSLMPAAISWQRSRRKSYFHA